MAHIITEQRLFREQLDLSVLYSVCEKHRLKLHAVRFFLRIVRAKRGAHLSAPRTAVWKVRQPLFFAGELLGRGRPAFVCPAYWERCSSVHRPSAVRGLWSDAKAREKVLIADFTDSGERGRKIGNYHFWTAIFSAAAIMLGGFLADFFTVQMIFYASSIVYFLSGLMMMKTG